MLSDILILQVTDVLTLLLVAVVLGAGVVVLVFVSVVFGLGWLVGKAAGAVDVPQMHPSAPLDVRQIDTGTAANDDPAGAQLTHGFLTTYTAPQSEPGAPHSSQPSGASSGAAAPGCSFCQKFRQKLHSAAKKFLQKKRASRKGSE